MKERNVGHDFKLIVKRNLLNHRKRPTTDRWRLNDKESDDLNRTYSFILEGGCDPLGLNCHRKPPFYSEQRSLLHLDVSGQSKLF